MSILQEILGWTQGLGFAAAKRYVSYVSLSALTT